ncbi:MAG: iron-sulfur cluster assembly scaffold protein [Mycoplasmatales bacterium]|nr:iron-sulfur cluster assembly scaffold protein [Mycoplasmatales bacterium]
MQYNNPHIRRKIIMKHYSKPDLKEKLIKEDFSHYSSQCVDELHIKWRFDNGIIKEVNWDGKGCAVFQSSTDIFLSKIINKNRKEILEIAQNYENMINQNGQKWLESLLGELVIFENVKKQLNRLNCANMISQAIIKELK